MHFYTFFYLYVFQKIQITLLEQYYRRDFNLQILSVIYIHVKKKEKKKKINQYRPFKITK